MVTGDCVNGAVWKNIPGCVCTAPEGSTTFDVPSLGCLGGVITGVIDFAFAFLGAALLLLLMWGAIRFIISRGDPKGIQEAQKTIIYAVIGAVVVIGSFILINIVTTTLGLPDILTNFKIYW